jgi:hypothetical protein
MGRIMARVGLQTILAGLRAMFTAAWWRNVGYREIDGPRDTGPQSKSGYDSIT